MTPPSPRVNAPPRQHSLHGPLCRLSGHPYHSSDDLTPTLPLAFPFTGASLLQSRVSGLSVARAADGEKVRFGGYALEARGVGDAVTYLMDDRSMAFTGPALLIGEGGGSMLVLVLADQC
jgi:hypothetical protein